eukprot:COSAG02_NODE_540_length_20599_cov_14.046339_7_plen_65_part_00
MDYCITVLVPVMQMLLQYRHCKHFGIFGILLVAVALQLRALALLSNRSPALAHGQEASPLSKHN